MVWWGTLTLFIITILLGIWLAWLGYRKAKLIFTQDHCEGTWRLKKILHFYFLRPNSNFFKGDYRYAHIRVRINAESIAFFSGEENERNYLDRMFLPAVKNYRKILTINFLMNGRRHFPTFPILLAPLKFSGLLIW
jgi:hypothetical protein